MLRTASISSAMLFLGCAVFFFSLDLAFFICLASFGRISLFWTETTILP
jgi:hypothetical protein